jgi:opacity protein-like surface antigen
MLRRLLVLSLLIPALAAPALLTAQSAPAARHTPNFELYGGYSYVFRSYSRTSTNLVTNGMNGWDASLKVPAPIFGSWLGIKGDVSGSYRNDSPDFNPSAYFFLLGPQVSVHLGRSTLFVHGLLGSAHLNQEAIPSLKSDNTFAVAVGGGLDAGFSRHWAWRVTGDFYNTNFQSSDANIHGIVNSNGRISTGPVFRF